MIGKQISGRSFAGCIRYLLQKEKALILEVQGVSHSGINELIRDFNMQRKLNPKLGKAVGHLILSWSEKDSSKLSSSIMKERAIEYLELMGITDTQYLVIQHKDRLHPHLHIVYNRVNNQGKTITDANNYHRNVKVCKELSLKYGFYLANGKAQVNRRALRAKDKVRYELYDMIKNIVGKVATWTELEKALSVHGIELHYKLKSGTTDIQGISFSKDGLTLKGSAIDRSLSYANLTKQLTANQFRQQFLKPSPVSEVNNKPELNPSQTAGKVEHQTLSLLETLLDKEQQELPPELSFKQRKKKKQLRL